ncbi:26S proteasome regulatory subunit 6B [Glycine soja]
MLLDEGKSFSAKNKKDIGGCDIQKQEIREAVELPLTHHELYKKIGIDPPRGVLLYGPPGTGKTMLAKAVANHTTASFIRAVGSEFVRKYAGESNIFESSLPFIFQGPRMKQLFVEI